MNAPQFEEPFRPTTAPRRNRVALAISALAAALVAGLAAAFFLTRQPASPSAVVDTPTTAAAAQTTAAAASPTASRPYVVTGSVSLISGFRETGSACAGEKSKSDITEGTRVSVLDASGTRIAEAKLGPGQVDGLSCVFLFTVENVPAGKGTYRVAVANRKSHEYSEYDFRSLPLNIAL